MKIVIVAIVALAACTVDHTETNPHDEIACEVESAWHDKANIAACEAACAGALVDGDDVNGDRIDDVCFAAGLGCPVDRVADFGGVRGCCVPMGTDHTRGLVVQFLACE